MQPKNSSFSSAARVRFESGIETSGLKLMESSPLISPAWMAFMISTALAGLAGLLIAPLFSVHSDMGTLFGIKAFAVAILGGIASASGVMLAGLVYGLIEALVTALLGSVYTQIVVFTVVILALAVMPNGLLGRAAVNKV